MRIADQRQRTVLSGLWDRAREGAPPVEGKPIEVPKAQPEPTPIPTVQAQPEHVVEPAAPVDDLTERS
jgi:hypothetical protein